MNDEIPFAETVRLAHSDAWQALGRLFEGRGGGTADYRSVRLMASGLPHPQWNSGDVLSAEVDLEAVRAFYGAHNVPWGLRVPSELPWSHGRPVLHLRLMGLVPAALRPSQPPDGLHFEGATAADLESVGQVDAVAFGSVAGSTRPWFAALLGAPPDVVTVARVLSDGQIVATGYSVAVDGLAGTSVYLAGIAVLPAYRGRGCGAALSSWLVRRAFDAGARLAHLHPDDDAAARLYRKLGFVETSGLDVYLDV